MRARSAALVVLGVLVASAASFADPVAPASTDWAGAGVFKGKLANEGSTSGPVDIDVDFGPNGGLGLAAGEFRITADDGMEAFTVEGTFTVDAKGQPVLTPDLVALENSMKTLMIHVCEDILLLGPMCAGIAGLDVVFDPAKIKLKVKTSSDPAELALSGKIPFALSNGMEQAKVAVSLKSSPPLEITK